MKAKLRLRTFFINTETALRLSNRAAGKQISFADLARSFIDEFVLANVTDIKDYQDDEKLILRSIYLTPEQDTSLEDLAAKFKVSKGVIFRAAIAKGIGIAKKGI